MWAVQCSMAGDKAKTSTTPAPKATATKKAVASPIDGAAAAAAAASPTKEQAQPPKNTLQLALPPAKAPRLNVSDIPTPARSLGDGAAASDGRIAGRIARKSSS